jgi:predicted RecB family nuclease
MNSVKPALPEDFVFSQSSLQDFEDCPRRFELRYVQDVRWPAIESEPVLESELSTLQGQQFHRLLHQHAVGIPAERLERSINDPEILNWWHAYLSWQTRLPEKRFPEMTLTAPVGEALVMAKYDLITRFDENTFLIVDWKTGKKPKRESLARRMQSIVYPYVLARAGDWLNDNRPIPAEQIRMVYWFSGDSATMEFTFNEESLREAEARLASTIQNISERFEFPLTHREHLCKFCVYRSLCDRGTRAGDSHTLGEDEAMNDEIERTSALSFDLDDIEEISF